MTMMISLGDVRVDSRKALTGFAEHNANNQTIIQMTLCREKNGWGTNVICSLELRGTHHKSLGLQSNRSTSLRPYVISSTYTIPLTLIDSEFQSVSAYKTSSQHHQLRFEESRGSLDDSCIIHMSSIEFYESGDESQMRDRCPILKRRTLNPKRCNSTRNGFGGEVRAHRFCSNFTQLFRKLPIESTLHPLKFVGSVSSSPSSD